MIILRIWAAEKRTTSLHTTTVWLKGKCFKNHHYWGCPKQLELTRLDEFWLPERAHYSHCKRNHTVSITQSMTINNTLARMASVCIFLWLIGKWVSASISTCILSKLQENYTWCQFRNTARNVFRLTNLIEKMLMQEHKKYENSRQHASKNIQQKLSSNRFHTCADEIHHKEYFKC